MTLDEQIAWLEKERKGMKARLDLAVSQNRLSQESASYKLAVSLAALTTLTQLRGILKGKQ